MSFSTSATFARVAAALAAGAVLCPSLASASTYGTLIARRSSGPSSAFDVHFEHVAAPRRFVLVVTETSPVSLNFTWSVHCLGSSHRVSGGASGEATVSNGHWVKRVNPNWIKHPASCSGVIEGTAGGSPVLARIFVG